MIFQKCIVHREGPKTNVKILHILLEHMQEQSMLSTQKVQKFERLYFFAIYYVGM